MKGLDVFIVRLLPFVLFVITGINIICCSCGIDVRDSYALHSHSAIYATALFLISLCNKRYHCIWNRAMYVYLIITPCLNYIDLKLDFCTYHYGTLVFIAILYISTLLTTAYLATKHFVTVSKRRMSHGE
jgi:hypothetical protein